LFVPARAGPPAQRLPSGASSWPRGRWFVPGNAGPPAQRPALRAHRPGQGGGRSSL